MLGDHGYFRKCEPYEGSANIPFIVEASPEIGLARGATSTEPVGLEDVMPTLLELAAVECPRSVDGTSLVPALRTLAAQLRDWLHFEHAPIYDPTQGFHALVDRRYKYIWRASDGREQLFDLATDPHETRDLGAESGHRALLETWRDRLARRLSDRPEGFSDGEKLKAGRAYRPIAHRPAR